MEMYGPWHSRNLLMIDVVYLEERRERKAHSLIVPSVFSYSTTQ